MPEENYVIVLDKDRDFCRLFRSNSEDVPAGEILWSGMGLRRGYDAMIRLNKERKPVEIYSVCSTKSKKGREVFKLIKGQPEKEIHVISIHAEYKPAREEIKRLTEERNAVEEAEKAHARAIMKRVGIHSKRIPKWTARDLEYIAWLKRTGKMAA